MSIYFLPSLQKAYFCFNVGDVCGLCFPAPFGGSSRGSAPWETAFRRDNGVKYDSDPKNDVQSLSPAFETDGDEEDEEDEELSPLVVGYAWVARITTYSAEFAVLVWFGWFLDRTYGWSPVGVLSGAAIGVSAFVAGLVSTAKRLENEDARERLRRLQAKRKR